MRLQGAMALGLAMLVAGCGGGSPATVKIATFQSRAGATEEPDSFTLVILESIIQIRR